MSKNIFVSNVALSVAAKLKSDLLAQGFELHSLPHALFSGKKPGVVCTLYHSGKLVVQGSQTAPFVEFYLEPEILHALPFTYPTVTNAAVSIEAHIGVDESGKGDFFGPLCIAAVYATEELINWLSQQGVRDSKTLSDAFIAKIVPKLSAKLPHHIVSIGPARYNELYAKFKNLNNLLAWGHATAIEQLSQQTDCQQVVVDQFAHEALVTSALKKKGLQLQLSQRHRAEEDPVVAAASLMARYAFLQGLQALSKRFELSLPKGASAQVILVGKQFVQKYGQQQLNQVAKLHFKTTQAIT